MSLARAGRSALRRQEKGNFEDVAGADEEKEELKEWNF